MKCDICGNNQNNKELFVREMSIGTRDTFTYLQCGNCGCTKLINPPTDMNKYYNNYYSLIENPERKITIKDKIIEKFLTRAALDDSLLPKIFLKKHVKRRNFYPLTKHVKHNDKILDIGCGTGNFIYKLKNADYDCVGIEPYIQEDIKYNNGLIIQKKFLNEVTDKYDIIMANHAFEHMNNPNDFFPKIEEILNDNGTLILRIPLAQGYCFEKYKENYYGFHAPFHFYIHTEESIKILLNKTNLKLKNVVFDSVTTQFIMSEQIKFDIAMSDETSYAVNPEKSIFTQEQITDYEFKTKMLNKCGLGDQAIFYIEKV